jgi:hypothetical protein
MVFAWDVFGPNLRGQAMFFYKSYDKIECKNVHFSKLFGSKNFNLLGEMNKE